MNSLFRLLPPGAAAFLHDFWMVPLAWLGAFWLRFNLEMIPPPFWHQALWLLPLILFVHVVTFIRFGLYRGVWRFASMPDFVRIIKAVLIAILSSSMVIFLLTRMENVPRSVPILHSVLLLILLCLPRFFYRWLNDHHHSSHVAERVLIIGAGQAGEMLARDLLQDPDRGYQPVAFVDDDLRKIGTEVRGVRVVASCDHIHRVVVQWAVDLIFIAIPTASAEAMRRIVEYCEASGRPFRTLPKLQDLLSQRTVVQDLREVDIEDLLGREPVCLDWDIIRRRLNGRVVLVSGGGGSIGSELCRQIANLNPKALVIVDRGEFNLYCIDRELRSRYPKLCLHARLADICDAKGMDYLLCRFRPDVVFHAAAYKHVPLLECHVREALRNNLFGTVNLAESASRYGCQIFVLISSDKAVKPLNVLGVSKQLAEIYCQNFTRRSKTRFVTVRFGNVLNSAGSVVPLFREQIAAGGPVTVTHPLVSRYFMTIPEASQLIMQAGAIGEDRKIYVLDMGKPVNILYLARQMIRLSGKIPGQDIELKFTGLRPGDKIFEELFHEDEPLMPTAYSKLLLAQHNPVDWICFMDFLQALRKACESYDENAIEHLIAERFPTVAVSRPLSLPLPRAAPN